MSSLPPRAQLALHEVGNVRRWRSGQILLGANERAEGAFVVLDGRVRIRSVAPTGEEQILGWLGPGMFGALIPLLAGVPVPCDFVADGPCEARHFSPKRLFALLERDPATTLAIARMLSLRLSRFLNAYTTQVLAPLPVRVWATMGRLARWSHASGEHATGELTITQADLARAVGASRYRVGLELKKLEASGVVSLSRGRITMLSRRRPTRPSRDRSAM
jgi:CRP-like cAMP-binding protein